MALLELVLELPAREERACRASCQPLPDKLAGVSDKGSSHYFTSPSDAATITWHHLNLAGREYEIASAGGVFSAAKVDLGTQVLLRTVAGPDHQLPQAGVLVDLGCGWGALSLVMATLAPGAQVWAVDVNHRALELTRRNAQRAGLANIKVATPDQASTLRPDVIWSNPPIRVGKTNLHQLLDGWLSRLLPQGHADLVIQRHLGADSLAKWLTDQGYPTDRLASAKGYRVLRCGPRAHPEMTLSRGGEPGQWANQTDHPASKTETSQASHRSETASQDPQGCWVNQATAAVSGAATGKSSQR